MNIIIPQKLSRYFNLAVVVSRFNVEITQALLEGALKRLRELAFPEANVTVVWVPGAVEIGLVSQRLARKGIYEAIICLGAVIQGETDHYQHVCQHVSNSCQRIALDTDTPVIFGVLTTATEAQAQARVGGSEGHLGHTAVDTALAMVSVLRQLDEL